MEWLLLHLPMPIPSMFPHNRNPLQALHRGVGFPRAQSVPGPAT